MRTLILFCSALCLGLILSGCTSTKDYAAKRRQQLLAAYPPGQTTRADVLKRWSPIKPSLSETRPVSGWIASMHPGVRERTIASEQRTGQRVSSCERYFGADGWSGGLCYGWFYYDDRDYVVDVEWQWHTD